MEASLTSSWSCTKIKEVANTQVNKEPLRNVIVFKNSIDLTVPLRKEMSFIYQIFWRAIKATLVAALVHRFIIYIMAEADQIFANVLWLRSIIAICDTCLVTHWFCEALFVQCYIFTCLFYSIITACTCFCLPVFSLLLTNSLIAIYEYWRKNSGVCKTITEKPGTTFK